jgi:hypothetical protein
MQYFIHLLLVCGDTNEGLETQPKAENIPLLNA